MKILVIGSGGREHSIILKLKESKHNPEIYAAPGNGGIRNIATCIDISPSDIQGVINFSVENNIDLVVVTPDNPLVEGMVDALEENNIKAFGPKKAAALLEGSKAFAKNFMDIYHIPTASYKEFTDYDTAKWYIEEKNKYPIVIKVDGLALGKGVLIPESKDEALNDLKEIMVDNAFGESGSKVIIEEFLSGFEISVMAFTDGKTLKLMPSAMDYKKAYDGDKGPNTGGMGVIAPHPLFNKELEKECYEKIFLPTMSGLKKEDILYKGVIYFGLMITEDGPYMLEYNCRFGDPETQVVLPLIEGDLLDIFLAVCDENLESTSFTSKDKSGTCVIMSSSGYPVKYETGYEISGLEKVSDELIVYHAGTKLDGSVIKTSGGRVLGVTALSDTLDEAIDKAYEGVKTINFKDSFYRMDIGKYRRN